MIQRTKKFFEDARHEFRHVNWPTRREAVRLTVVVIGISLGLALFLGAFDLAFTYAIREFILQ